MRVRLGYVACIPYVCKRVPNVCRWMGTQRRRRKTRPRRMAALRAKRARSTARLRRRRWVQGVVGWMGCRSWVADGWAGRRGWVAFPAFAGAIVTELIVQFDGLCVCEGKEGWVCGWTGLGFKAGSVERGWRAGGAWLRQPRYLLLLSPNRLLLPPVPPMPACAQVCILMCASKACHRARLPHVCLCLSLGTAATAACG